MNKFIPTVIPFRIEPMEEKIQIDDSSHVSTETIHSDILTIESSELVEKDNNSMIRTVSTQEVIPSTPSFTPSFIPTQSTSSIAPSISTPTTSSLIPSLTSSPSTPSPSLTPSPSIQPCGDSSNPCLLVLTLSAEASKVYFH